MKERFKVLSIIMIASILLSGLLIENKIINVIVPSFDTGAVVPIYTYVLLAVVLISAVLKFFSGIFGFTALSKNTTEPEMQKKLKLSGKLSVPVLLCGILILVIKIFYGFDDTMVIEIFDIALDILLGLTVAVSSMYIRSGRD